VRPSGLFPLHGAFFDCRHALMDLPESPPRQFGISRCSPFCIAPSGRLNRCERSEAVGGAGATVNGVSADSIVRWVRRRIGSVLMRRFVWPVPGIGGSKPASQRAVRPHWRQGFTGRCRFPPLILCNPLHKTGQVFRHTGLMKQWSALHFRSKRWNRQ
jgi:hypothetical protein